MGLNDGVENHPENGEPDTDSQINNDITSLLRTRLCHGLNGGDQVQATVYAEGCSGDRHRASNHKLGGNVAPDWRPVDDVRIPNHGIDELVQACQARPKHVQASARVPGFDMPWKGNHTHHEADKGPCGEKPIRDVGDHLNTIVDDKIRAQGLTRIEALAVR